MRSPMALPAPPGTDRDVARSWWWLGACVGFGIWLDIVAGSPPGLGVSLSIAIAAIAVAVAGRGHGVTLLAAAVVIGSFASVRASTTLLTIDVLAACALIAAASTFAVDGRLGRITARSFMSRAWLAPLEMIPHAVEDLTGPARMSARGPAIKGAARAVIVALPVVIVLVALLASADRVFADVVAIPTGVDPGELAGDIAVAALGAVGLACVVAATGYASTIVGDAGRELRLQDLRPVDGVVLLAAAIGVFLLFVGVQFTVAFGGQRHVLQSEGLTYAEYARSGFWQLFGAAAIAGAVLGAAWLGRRRPLPARDHRILATLSVVLVVLVGVVLASAFQRLRLYEQAYGYTTLRVLVHVTIIAIGVLLGCAAIAIVRGRAGWLPTASVAIAVVAIVALNVMDLEAFIARANLSRAVSGETLDVAQLSALSADAVGPAVDALPSLSGAHAAAVTGWLACAAGDLRDDGWLSANLARARARAALTGVPSPTCAV